MKTTTCKLAWTVFEGDDGGVTSVFRKTCSIWRHGVWCVFGVCSPHLIICQSVSIVSQYTCNAELVLLSIEHGSKGLKNHLINPMGAWQCSAGHVSSVVVRVVIIV